MGGEEPGQGKGSRGSLRSGKPNLSVSSSSEPGKADQPGGRSFGAGGLSLAILNPAGCADASLRRSRVRPCGLVGAAPSLGIILSPKDAAPRLTGRRGREDVGQAGTGLSTSLSGRTDAARASWSASHMHGDFGLSSLVDYLSPIRSIPGAIASWRGWCSG